MGELGKSLAAIDIALAIGALGSPKSIANTISKSIPLAFTGLAVALGSRCGLSAPTPPRRARQASK